MTASVVLFQNENQFPIQVARFLELKTGLMRFPNLRINPPGCLWIRINCFSNLPALLIEISGWIFQFHNIRRVFGSIEQFEIREMKIAIVLSARSFVRK